MCAALAFLLKLCCNEPHVSVVAAAGAAHDSDYGWMCGFFGRLGIAEGRICYGERFFAAAGGDMSAGTLRQTPTACCGACYYIVRAAMRYLAGERCAKFGCSLPGKLWPQGCHAGDAEPGHGLRQQKSARFVYQRRYAERPTGAR